MRYRFIRGNRFCADDLCDQVNACFGRIWQSACTQKGRDKGPISQQGTSEGIQGVRGYLSAGIGIIERVAFGGGNQLVVLDQSVIGLLREGEGRQQKGVQYRQLQQFRASTPVAKDGQVVPDDIMAPHEGGIPGKLVQPGVGVVTLIGRRRDDPFILGNKGNLPNLPPQGGFDIEKYSGFQVILYTSSSHILCAEMAMV
jgi:hypothetical protein